MKSIKYLIFLLLCCTSCITIYHKSLLTLLDVPFDIDSVTFRTDGYYYTEKTWDRSALNEDENSKLNSSVYIAGIVFYLDGYVYAGRGQTVNVGGIVSDSVSSYTKSIRNSLADFERWHVNRLPIDGPPKSKSRILGRGLYRQTATNKLAIQYFMNWGGDYRLVQLKGEVLNDTTLLIHQKYMPQCPWKSEDKNEEIEQIYKFRKFDVVPDTVNYIREFPDKFSNI